MISIQKCFQEIVKSNFSEIDVTNTCDIVTFRLNFRFEFPTLLRNNCILFACFIGKNFSNVLQKPYS